MYFYQTIDEVSKETVADFCIDKAETMLADGLIADLANLKNQPVYIGSGEFDTTVPLKYQEATNLFYQNYEANIVYDFMPIHHQFPVDLPLDY